jgi:hypothetical protein
MTWITVVGYSVHHGRRFKFSSYILAICERVHGAHGRLWKGTLVVHTQCPCRTTGLSFNGEKSRDKCLNQNIKCVHLMQATRLEDSESHRYSSSPKYEDLGEVRNVSTLRIQFTSQSSYRSTNRNNQQLLMTKNIHSCPTNKGLCRTKKSQLVLFTWSTSWLHFGLLQLNYHIYVGHLPPYLNMPNSYRSINLSLLELGPACTFYLRKPLSSTK